MLIKILNTTFLPYSNLNSTLLFEKSLGACFGLFLFMTGCLPIPSQNYVDELLKEKSLAYDNTTYETKVKSVQLYPKFLKNPENTSNAPAVLSISQNVPFVLEFDILGEDNESLQAKVLHCDRNWKPSQLNEIQFINEVNLFNLRAGQVSFNTKVSYTHFYWELPRLKISGNYLLKVFREGEENDLLLSHRLVIYEPLLSIKAETNFSNDNQVRDQNQQIDFDLFYPGIELQNPQELLSVVIRQNYRWKDAIYNLKARQVREFQKKLDFRYVSQENNFPGGQEFRRFDIKSNRFLGFQVASINTRDSINTAQLVEDESRMNRAYVRRPDQNGAFEINRYESTENDAIESDYFYCTFRIKSPNPLEKDPYVWGGFNLWQFEEENKMTYNKKRQEYESRILLKQGQYNYLYVGEEGESQPKFDLLEGSHVETENRYEIIAYYRYPGERYDRVIGYSEFSSQEEK